MTDIIWSASSGGLTGQTHAMTQASLADTEARQGVKAAIETPIGGKLYVPYMVIQMTSAPTEGDSVYFYLSWSNSGTAGTDNDGGATGADAAYSGLSSDLAFSLRNHLQLAGQIRLSATTSVHRKRFPPVVPKGTHVNGILYNAGGVALGSTASNLGVGLLDLPNA